MELTRERMKNNAYKENFPVQALEDAVQEALIMSDFFRLAVQSPQIVLLEVPEKLGFLQQLRELVTIPQSIAPMKVFNRDRTTRTT